MVHFVGLDVSVKTTSVCVVDDAGKVILEQKVPTDPAEIIAILTSLGVSFGRIGIVRERFEIDGDVLGRVLREVTAFRNDAGDRFTYIAHLLARERANGRRVVASHARGGAQRFDRLLEIHGGEHRRDAGRRLRGRRVD